MVASINLSNGTLRVDIEGADQLWALKRQLQIPLAHVVGAAEAQDEARQWLHGIRLGGTHVPGIISAGRFYSQGKWVFWDVHPPDKAISIGLRDEHYSRIVLESDDPAGQIRRINAAVDWVSIT